MKILEKIKYYLYLFLLLPNLAFAAEFESMFGGKCSDYYCWIKLVWGWALTILIPLSAVVLMAAGVIYTTSGGDTKRIELAKKLIWGVASNFQLISNNLAASAFGVKTLLMVILTGLLTLKSEVAGLDSGDSLSTFQTGLYGIFTAGVMLASALMFMSNAQRLALDSNFANLVYDWRVILIAAPVLYIIGSSFIRSKY